MRAGASRTLRRRQSLRDGTPRRLHQPAEVYLASSPTVPAAGCRVVAERIVRPLRRPEISRAPGAACCLGAAVRRGDTWLRLNRLASRIRNQRGKRIYFFASEDLLCMHITRPSTDFFQASMATYVRLARCHGHAWRQRALAACAFSRVRNHLHHLLPLPSKF
jgi:hypothetical protein